MGSQSMGPTIIHFSAVDGDVCGRDGGDGRDDRGDSGSGERGCEATSPVRAMIAGVAGGELANALLIAEFELGLEKVEYPLADGLEPEFLSGSSKEAGLFEHGKGECDHSDIGDRYLA